MPFTINPAVGQSYFSSAVTPILMNLREEGTTRGRKNSNPKGRRHENQRKQTSSDIDERIKGALYTSYKHHVSHMMFETYCKEMITSLHVPSKPSTTQRRPQIKSVLSTSVLGEVWPKLPQVSNIDWTWDPDTTSKYILNHWTSLSTFYCLQDRPLDMHHHQIKRALKTLLFTNHPTYVKCQKTTCAYLSVHRVWNAVSCFL